MCFAVRFTSPRQAMVVDQCVPTLRYAFGASQGALALRPLTTPRAFCGLCVAPRAL
jgi:hypothetical protein